MQRHCVFFSFFFWRQKSQARVSGKTTVDEFSGNLSGVFVGKTGAVSVYSVALCLLVYIQSVGRPGIGEVPSRSR